MGIPANYLVASKCLGLDGKTFREMPESQEYLTENLGYDPEVCQGVLRQGDGRMWTYQSDPDPAVQ